MFEIEILIHYHGNMFMLPSCRVIFFRRQFGWKVFLIGLLYWTLKNKLKIQGHHPFKLGFGFTTTRMIIVYEHVMKSGTN